MEEFGNVVAVVVMAIAFVFIAITFMTGVSTLYNGKPLQDEVDRVVRECEKELARNLHCSYKIEAYVAEENKDE